MDSERLPRSTSSLRCPQDRAAIPAGPSGRCASSHRSAHPGAIREPSRWSIGKPCVSARVGSPVLGGLHHEYRLEEVAVKSRRKPRTTRFFAEHSGQGALAAICHLAKDDRCCLLGNQLVSPPWIAEDQIALVNVSHRHTGIPRPQASYLVLCSKGWMVTGGILFLVVGRSNISSRVTPSNGAMNWSRRWPLTNCPLLNEHVTQSFSVIAVGSN